MSSYTDLSDNVEDSYSFVLRGNTYTMRYPTTEELEDIQNLNNEYDSLDDKTTDEAKALNDKLQNAIYVFITPDGHKTDIKEALRKENVKVLMKFNDMIKKELSV